MTALDHAQDRKVQDLLRIAALDGKVELYQFENMGEVTENLRLEGLPIAEQKMLVEAVTTFFVKREYSIQYLDVPLDPVTEKPLGYAVLKFEPTYRGQPMPSSEKVHEKIEKE